MLKKLRKPGHAKNSSFKKWFAYFIFALICLVFVFFTPIGSQLGGGYGEGIVAYVGKEALRSREYSLLETALRRQYSVQLNQGSAADAEKIRERVRKQALNEMIQIHLMAQGAQKNGFLVSDQEVIEEIRGIPAFQEKGQFVYSLYNGFLKNRKWNAKAFERRIRFQIRARNWNALFFQAVRSNQLEKDFLEIQNQFNVKIRFVELELGEEFSSEMESLVQKKDKPRLRAFLKKKGYKWKTTESFSFLSSPILQLGEKELIIDKIIQQFPLKGLIPETIKTEGSQYIVDIISFDRTENKKGEQISNFILNFNKPKALLENWMDVQRETIGVRVNDKFFNFSGTSR